MQRAAGRARGAMAADARRSTSDAADAVDAAVARGAGRVQLANFNQPGQIVISGDEAAVRWRANSRSKPARNASSRSTSAAPGIPR